MKQQRKLYYQIYAFIFFTKNKHPKITKKWKNIFVFLVSR